MTDVLMIVFLAVAFAGAAAYVLACDYVTGPFG